MAAHLMSLAMSAYCAEIAISARRINASTASCSQGLIGSMPQASGKPYRIAQNSVDHEFGVMNRTEFRQNHAALGMYPRIRGGVWKSA
jgi:hypothetical protein